MRGTATSNAARVFRWASTICALLAPPVAAYAAWRVATAPAYVQELTSGTLGRAPATSAGTTATLAQVNGPGIYVLLAIPALLALVPLAFRRTELGPALEAGAAILVGGFVVFGAPALGTAFVPAALLLLAAALLGWVERRVKGTGRPA